MLRNVSRDWYAVPHERKQGKSGRANVDTGYYKVAERAMEGLEGLEGPRRKSPYLLLCISILLSFLFTQHRRNTNTHVITASMSDTARVRPPARYFLFHLLGAPRGV